MRSGWPAGPIEPEVETRTFDVFQGLIFAVDTKDRYTKQHSEDVARYGVFLAERLGLSRRGDRHDPRRRAAPRHRQDRRSRTRSCASPASLTAEEYAIVKQHVALGDLIVRDLPDVDVIRAGVRHHHERWDGDGYLDRLAGEEIPLVARILAVGDAFSAMTTTRPYRKALDHRGGPPPARGRCRHAARGAPRHAVRRRHRDDRPTRRCPARTSSRSGCGRRIARWPDGRPRAPPRAPSTAARGLGRSRRGRRARPRRGRRRRPPAGRPPRPGRSR